MKSRKNLVKDAAQAALPTLLLNKEDVSRQQHKVCQLLFGIAGLLILGLILFWL